MTNKLTPFQQTLKIEFVLTVDLKIGQIVKKHHWYRPCLTLDNIPFETTLQYKGYVKGRSSLNIMWYDEYNNRYYYSAMSLLHDCLQKGEIDGNKLVGTFYFEKKGTSILITKIWDNQDI